MSENPSPGERLVDRLLGPRLRACVAEDLHRARLIVMFSAVLCATACILTVTILALGWDMSLLPSAAVAAVLYAANLGYVRRTGALVRAGFAVCVIGIVAVIAASWLGGGPMNPALDWTIVVAILAPFVLPLRLTVACVGLVFANLAVQWTAERAGYRFAPLASADSLSTGSHALLMLVTVTVAFLFERARRIALAERDLAVQRAAASDAARVSMADNIDAVIYTVDRDLRLIAGNRHFRRFSHASGEPPIQPGQSVLDAAADTEHATVRALYARAFTGATVAVEGQFELRSRSFAAELRLVPVRSASGEVLAVTAYARDISARMRTAAELQRLNREMAEMALLAGKAEVATDVLHNVGNILVGIGSANRIAEALQASKIAFVGKTAALLPEAPAALASFLADDARGRNVRPYLRQLAEELEREHAEELAGTSALNEQLAHVKAVVARQQGFARSPTALELVPIAELIDQALRLCGDCQERRENTVTVDAGAVPPVALHRHRVLEVLANLLRNSHDALAATAAADRRIAIQATHDHDHLRIAITDNGAGIASEHLPRLFAYGFTTKPGGHGFGLAGALLAARSMGGSLVARSDGPGTGATFTLELPFLTSVTNHAQERAA